MTHQFPRHSLARQAPERQDRQRRNFTPWLLEQRDRTDLVGDAARLAHRELQDVRYDSQSRDQRLRPGLARHWLKRLELGSLEDWAERLPEHHEPLSAAYTEFTGGAS